MTGHCWTGRNEVETAIPDCTHGGHDDWDQAMECAYGREQATCLLEDGHSGPHEWTPDSEIVVSFAPVGAAHE